MSHKKTADQRIINGTFRGDRAYSSEPARLEPKRLRLPRHLSDRPEAREFWSKVVKPLNDQNILVGSDLAMMETLATLYADMRDAQEEAREHNSTVIYSNGNPGAHPARARADKVTSQFVSALAKAGLTPAQHHKLEVTVESDTDVDPMESILDGAG